MVYSASDFPLATDPSDGPVKLAVIGHPIKHSASPQMHQAALNELNLDISYVRIEVLPGHLTSDLEHLKKAGFIGANVTVPYKFEALAHCSELTSDAQLLGAVNTVLFRPEGDLGHNSDGPGFIDAIADSFSKKLGELKVLIVGAGGGAGTAIATQCIREGSPKLILANRSQEKIIALKEQLLTIDSTADITTLALDDSELISAAHGSDLIVNTTSLGLKENDPSPLSAEAFLPHHLVYDTIYNPPQTAFLKAANDAGAQTDNGLSMLLHQGALSFALWLGQKPSLAAMREGLGR